MLTADTPGLSEHAAHCWRLKSSSTSSSRPRSWRLRGGSATAWGSAV